MQNGIPHLWNDSKDHYLLRLLPVPCSHELHRIVAQNLFCFGFFKGKIVHHSHFVVSEWKGYVSAVLHAYDLILCQVLRIFTDVATGGQAG